MAERVVTVGVKSLMDVIKDLISKLAVEILMKRGLYARDHDLTVFCSKTSAHGDLLIRKEFLMSVVKESCTVGQQLEVFTDDIVHDLTELVSSSEKLSCYFAEITHSSLGHINIKLCRTHCFEACIGEIQEAKNGYGTWPSTGEQLYLFIHDLVPSGHEVSSRHCESGYCTEFHKLLNYPVTKARGVLIASLLSNLLMAAGFTVAVCNVSDSHGNNESLFKSLLCSPKVLPYTCNQSAVEDGIQCINVRKYLSERKLVGKGGYNGALNRITVRNATGVTQTGHKALDVIKAIPGCHDTSNAKIIHIVHRQASHDVEKAIAVSLVATDNNLQHQILAHSGIKSDDKTELVFSQLLKRRELSSMEACRVRYGNTTPDVQMKHISYRMAEASVKFDLLSVDPKCQVQVKCSLDDNVDLRSSGSFVLYNYARIATIMDKFEAAVKRGTYLPLPHLSSIDFSLLTDESEWVLLFQYIAAYPSMIREVSTLEKQGLGLYVTSGIKKLCIFLIHLAHEFSSYYSRVKILLEPQPHLLPLMYARLMLVSSVKQILYNGLKLLSIEPLNQL